MGFAILGLACWRLSSLLVDEDGPWDMFARLRYKLGVRYDERSVAFGSTMLSNLLLCIWCSSVWVAGSIFLAYLIFPQATLCLMTPLALSALAILVSKVVNNE